MRLVKSLLATFLTAAIFASSSSVSTAQSAPAPVPPAVQPPSSPVAVLDFRTEGLTSNWWGQWQPGIALSDLVTSNLVSAGYNVVDRTHLADVMREHSLSSSGEVSDASLIQSGRLTGAKFLIVGNILQFAHTGTSGAGAGALLPGILGAVASGIKTDRVTLKVEVRIIDSTSGRILSSFNDEKTQSEDVVGRRRLWRRRSGWLREFQFRKFDNGAPRQRRSNRDRKDDRSDEACRCGRPGFKRTRAPHRLRLSDPQYW